MNNATTNTRDLTSEAATLVSRLNTISASLLQRQFRLGYSDALTLIDELERIGVITPECAGRRTVTEFGRVFASKQIDAAPPSAREVFDAWAIDPFEGGDGGDPGSPTAPSIWLFGIEHGNAANLHSNLPAAHDESYSIDNQLKYPFNRNAFKLFAAIHGYPVDEYERFARLYQPWVPGARGYFKGNLYPYPCRRIGTWPEEAVRETGFEHKHDMLTWCKTHRLPAITAAVARYRPRLFIGVGTTMREDFSRACYGTDVPFEEYQFAVNGYAKRLYHATLNGARLVVLPHISNGRNGLNSNSALHLAGTFIAGLIR